jgi:hypothetical protein
MILGLRPWEASPALAAAPGHLRRSAYTGLEGSTFAVAGAAPQSVRLLSISDVAGAASQGRLVGSDDAFVLTFAGGVSSPLASGIHALSHPWLGSFDVFVSPVDVPAGDQRYEVLVDRSVGAPKPPPEPAASKPAAPGSANPVARPARRPLRRRRVRRVSRRGRVLRRSVLRRGTRGRGR